MQVVRMICATILAIGMAHAVGVDWAAIEAPRNPAGEGDEKLSVQELMKKYYVPGVSVSIVQNFQVIGAKGYGVADVETGAPVTLDTLFQAASISKPVAAMAALKAVQDGLFGVDQDVNTILKSWKLDLGEFKDDVVTPAMLLSHTGGTTVHGFGGYAPSGTIPTAHQVLSGEGNTDRVYVDIGPLSKWRYSGGGVTVMQVALTDTVGRPYADILREWVLDPIGMTTSTYEQPLPEARWPEAARAHDNRGQRTDAPWHVYPEQAAAGLWTTQTDLCKFAIEVMLSRRGEANNVLGPELTEAMITKREIGDYGLGFGLHGSDAVPNMYFGHGGSNWGFQCDLVAHNRKGYGAAIMTNGDNGRRVIGELHKRIAKVYKWEGEI